MPQTVEIKAVDGRASPQMRGLIWEQECTSNSMVTANSTLEKTEAFIVESDVRKNSFGNTVREISVF